MPLQRTVSGGGNQTMVSKTHLKPTELASQVRRTLYTEWSAPILCIANETWYMNVRWVRIWHQCSSVATVCWPPMMTLSCLSAHSSSHCASERSCVPTRLPCSLTTLSCWSYGLYVLTETPRAIYHNHNTRLAFVRIGYYQIQLLTIGYHNTRTCASQ